MGKTEIINGFKLAGPMADARHVLLRALEIIDAAEKEGSPISRGDLIEKVTTEFHVFPSNYSWLGSPGPKSPVDKLYTREKSGKVYVMKLMEEARALLGTGLSYDELYTKKLHSDWEKKGVFDFIKGGDICRLKTGRYDEVVVVVDPRANKGVSVLTPAGQVTRGHHALYFHSSDCTNNDCKDEGWIRECLRHQKKVAA